MPDHDPTVWAMPLKLPGTISEAAVVYAAAGIPIFPCVPGGKTPLTKRGFLDATTSLAWVERWWRRTPEANIGIATGHGVDVLDVDVHAIGTGFQALGMLQREHLVRGWGQAGAPHRVACTCTSHPIRHGSSAPGRAARRIWISGASAGTSSPRPHASIPPTGCAATRSSRRAAPRARSMPTRSASSSPQHHQHYRGSPPVCGQGLARRSRSRWRSGYRSCRRGIATRACSGRRADSPRPGSPNRRCVRCSNPPQPRSRSSRGRSPRRSAPPPAPRSSPPARQTRPRHLSMRRRG